MISEWTPKTDYFIKLPVARLQEVLDDVLVSIMGYDPEITYTFEDVCRSIKYLPNDEIAVGIQLRNAGYIKESAVLDYIDEESFQLAKYMYEVEEFLTKEEYLALEILPIEGLPDEV